MRTYLQMVNHVLIEMREDTVSDFTDEYVALVAQMVNQAKQQVEDAHTSWSALLTDIPIVTVQGQANYSLTNTQNRATIDSVVNTSTPGLLREASRRWINNQNLLGSSPESVPAYWTNNGVDSNGDSIITLFNTPSDTFNITVSAYVRPPELEEVTDTVLIPHVPIQDLAVAFAKRERGEVGGTTTAEYFELAKRSLSDAIAYDSARNDEEDDWFV